jgi:hypothetical protein
MRGRVLRHSPFSLPLFRWSAGYLSKLARQFLSLRIKATFSTYLSSLAIVKVWKQRPEQARGEKGTHA